MGVKSVSDVLLWTHSYGRAKGGRPARTYIQQLCEDTGCNPKDLPEAKNDREEWRERVRDISAGGTTWWWYMYLYLLFLWGGGLFGFFGFPWHFGLVSWFWFHLMYIRKVHGFLQLFYVYSANCRDRFLFLCCQSVSILILRQLGFLMQISISSVPFLSFLTVLGSKHFNNIFSILNGDSLLKGISSADSITMKDGK